MTSLKRILLVLAVVSMSPVAGAQLLGDLELSSDDKVNSIGIGGTMIGGALLNMPGAEDANPNALFYLSRARVRVDGNAFKKGFSYAVEVDFDTGLPRLQDAAVEYRYNRWLGIRVGQHRKIFSRQRITNADRLILSSRAITDGTYGAGRDLGLTLMSDPNASGFEWSWGIFNGTGFGGTEITTATMGPLFAIRLGWNSDGMDYTEADLTGGGFRYGIAYGNQTDLGNYTTESARQVSTTGTVDLGLKIAHFALSGAWFFRLAGPDWGDVEMTSMGLHGQLSYAISGKYVPAVRFTMIDPDGDDNNTMVIEGGFSYMLSGHDLKWQTQFSMHMPEVGDNDMLINTQLVVGL